MKVIRRDNLDRDYHPESLVTDFIPKWEADKIAETLNIVESENYYCVVEDDYELDTSSLCDVAGVKPVKDSWITGITELNAAIKVLLKDCPSFSKRNSLDTVRAIVAEAEEVMEAENGEHLCEELGDLLFNVLTLAQQEEASGSFTLQDALGKSLQKMQYRNPHLFGTELERWEQPTAAEVEKMRLARKQPHNNPSNYLGNNP